MKRFAQRDEIEVMYEDECWFSRYAMPRLRSHGPRGERTRIPIREGPSAQPQKAVAVYGALTIPEKRICIQCVDQQPRSETTRTFSSGSRWQTFLVMSGHGKNRNQLGRLRGNPAVDVRQLHV
mgnify:CR=1 FL=1